MAVEVEQIVSMPIVNPATRRSSRSFIFMGVQDRREDDKVIDWKGTSRPDRTITQLTIGYQAELYALAGDGEVLEIEYRLIQRPQLKYTRPRFTWAVVKADRKTAIKLCEIKADAEEIVDNWRSPAPIPTIEGRHTGDESRQAYEDRCFEQLLKEPQRMVSHNYLVTPAKLEQTRWWLWECSKRILDSRRNNRWIPNTGACFASDRKEPCAFLPLCEAVQNGHNYEALILDDFQRVTDPHPELGGHGENLPDRDILTFSSLSDLARCEMLFYWRHEQCLRKKRDEDSEPLWVGSAMHRGVAGYAKAGLRTAMAAVEGWAAQNPILGEDAAWKQDEQIARARAMVRAAAVKWPELSQVLDVTA